MNVTKYNVNKTFILVYVINYSNMYSKDFALEQYNIDRLTLYCAFYSTPCLNLGITLPTIFYRDIFTFTLV